MNKLKLLEGSRNLDHILAACWDDFGGSDEGGMDGSKLLGRMESVQWHPPNLTFSIRSRNLSDVQAELERRGELDKGVAGPVSVWFFRETLDAMFVCREQCSGLWIQFANLRDFDEMNERLQQRDKKKEMSAVLTEIAAFGPTAMVLANPPYGSLWMRDISVPLASSNS